MATLTVTGCEKTIDACAGNAAACLSVHLASDVTPLDELTIRVEGLGSRTTPTPAATIDFPVRFAIELPASAPDTVTLAIDGSRAGTTLASVAQSVTLGAQRHAQVRLTLRGTTVDLAPDVPDPGDGGNTADLAANDAAPDSAGADLMPAPIDLAGADLGSLVRLNIFTYSINGGQGQVAVSGATSCGTGCWLATPASTVMLVPSAYTGSHLIAMSGDCPFDRTGALCTLTMGGERTVFVSFESNAFPTNRVFVTSSNYAMTDVGAGTLDQECANLADSFAPADKASYKALYSRTGTTFEGILGSKRGWVRVDGLPFADTISDIKTDQIRYPILLTHTGSPAQANNDVWTGFLADGSTGDNCLEWSTTSETVTLGRPTGGSRGWTAQIEGLPKCAQSHPVYCFGTAYNNPLVVTVSGPPRRAAFTIPDGTGRPPNFGLGGADGACGDAAKAALLGGSYRAYLDTAAPGGGLGRFDVTLGPWARRDGTLLVANAQAFNPLSGPTGANGTSGMLAPFDKDAKGQPPLVPNYIWIGGAAGTCVDWSSIDPSAKANGIFPISIPSTAPQLSCNANATLLCLEQ